ncbi:NAD(P)H-dependent oxidoreductase subunit E [Massilia sp. H-1]|nr:NAD(P)H-dependent oxidoreductase subunit E [Massilia sp. H-1]
MSAAHLAALAQEMKLPQAAVYEVATFYHHFDVVREGEASPATLTVRVCDGLSCELAGAQDLLAKLPAILGKDVRVIAAPCIGRCEQAAGGRWLGSMRCRMPAANRSPVR